MNLKRALSALIYSSGEDFFHFYTAPGETVLECFHSLIRFVMDAMGRTSLLQYVSFVQYVVALPSIIATGSYGCSETLQCYIHSNHPKNL